MDLHERFAVASGIPVHEQRFVFAGKFLDPDSTIRNYSIQKESVVLVFPRPKPPPQKDLMSTIQEEDEVATVRSSTKSWLGSVFEAIRGPPRSGGPTFLGAGNSA
jgi:hypothetical protein